MEDLTIADRDLLTATIEHYVADIRQACLEDQENPDGEPGTIGRIMQERLAEVKAKLRTY